MQDPASKNENDSDRGGYLLSVGLWSPRDLTINMCMFFPHLLMLTVKGQVTILVLERAGIQVSARPHAQEAGSGCLQPSLTE